MRYVKFYIDTELIKNQIKNNEAIKDIKIIDSSIDLNGEAIEVTCVVESSENNIGCRTTNCDRKKIAL